MIEQTNKKIYIKLANRQTYAVSAHEVAHDRADYYARNDQSTSYEEEYEYTANESHELLDWLYNQMSWWELKPQFVEEEKLKIKDMEVIDTWVG
jgi:hypothetical protein